MKIITLSQIRTPAGLYDIKIENFSVDASPVTLDANLISFTTDENIEDDAGKLQIAKATFTFYNENAQFSSNAFYSSSALLSARIKVWYTRVAGGTQEFIFYGNIDSVKYRNKMRTVEVVAYSLVDEVANVKITEVDDYLSGNYVWGRLSANYSIGASTLLFNQTSVKRIIPQGEVIKFAGDSTAYTVVTTTQGIITITPPLVQARSTNDEVRGQNLSFSVSSVTYVMLSDIIRAIRALAGANDHSITTDRLRFYRAGSGSIYSINNLAVKYSASTGLFKSASPPADSFYHYEGSDEALGILRDFCASWGLTCITLPSSSLDYAFVFRHRNPTGSTAITIDNKIDYEIDYDWTNIFNEFKITYPVNLTDAPAATVPIKRTLKKTFTARNSHGIESDDYRCFIYSSSTIYEIDHVDVLDTAGNWTTRERRGLSPNVLDRAVRYLYTDLYQQEKEYRDEEYSTVYATASGTSLYHYLTLTNNIAESNLHGISTVFHIRRITRDHVKNRSKIRRVAMTT